MDLFESLEVVAVERRIHTVSGLNREARLAVEAGLGVVWVEGEISNLARPASGHLYWTLKDENAQLRCAMFRQRSRQLDFEPRNGQQVLVRGRVSIYEARGEFQLVVDHAEPAGEGLLRQRFDALKRKLAAEGLFDEARKRALPTLPRCIGVVTSPTGAAIRDVLTVLARRFPATDVLVYPTAVQGEGAAAEIAATLALADRRRDCDLLILARGGGSLEDLWAFNEEVVARALAAVELPVIVGVGHEVDFTIADFVADRRAPTPSGAAELAVPDRSAWVATLTTLEQRIATGTIRRLTLETRHRDTLTHRLYRAHPGVKLQQVAQTLDELEARLRRQILASVRDRRAELAAHYAALRGAAPKARLGRLSERCQWASRALGHAIIEQLTGHRNRIAGASRALDAVSPLATLDRGYAIATRTDGRLLADARQLDAGTDVSVRLARGSFDATVTRTRKI
jgi:exodeoxyribonuclease VII large subunit